jgi:hypothetical protein
MGDFPCRLGFQLQQILPLFGSIAVCHHLRLNASLLESNSDRAAFCSRARQRGKNDVF